MILFVVILLAVLAGVGSYGYFNQGAMISVNWWHWHWAAVPAWWPVAAATVALGILLLLYMSYAGLVVNRWRVSRRMADHDAAIDDLRRENLALRDEVTHMRGNRPLDRRETA